LYTSRELSEINDTRIHDAGFVPHNLFRLVMNPSREVC